MQLLLRIEKSSIYSFFSTGININYPLGIKYKNYIFVRI